MVLCLSRSFCWMTDSRIETLSVEEFAIFNKSLVSKCASMKCSAFALSLQKQKVKKNLAFGASYKRFSMSQYKYLGLSVNTDSPKPRYIILILDINFNRSVMR